MKAKHIVACLSLAALVLSGCDNKEPQEKEMPHDFTQFSDAGAFYYGRFQNHDFNMFCLYLLNGQTRADEGVISGVGTALWLDMNVALNNNNTIAPDDYIPARNDLDYPAFLKGGVSQDGQSVTGSYIYHRTLDGKAEYKLISNGSVKINFSGTKIKVDARVIADNETYTFSYEGFFSYTDMVADNPEPDSWKQVNNKGFSYGYRIDFGQDFGTSAVSDYRIWRILLADDNFDLETLSGTGVELQLEIITEAAATDIVGNYKVLTKDFPDDVSLVLKKGSALCGYTEKNSKGDDEYYGCWLFESSDLDTWYGATGGNVNISDNGKGGYSINYDFEDSYTKTKFKGSYNGALSSKTTKAVGNLRQSQSRVGTSKRRLASTRTH